jgi:hypothetical protein
VLFNLCRAAEETEGLVVLVEGFFDCIRVTQAERPCVSLMGCSLSGQQEAQLVAHFRQVVILLDGDEAGRRGAQDRHPAGAQTVGTGHRSAGRPAARSGLNGRTAAGAGRAITRGRIFCGQSSDCPLLLYIAFLQNIRGRRMWAKMPRLRLCGDCALTVPNPLPGSGLTRIYPWESYVGLGESADWLRAQPHRWLRGDFATGIHRPALKIDTGTRTHCKALRERLG